MLLDDKDEFVSTQISLGELNNLLNRLQFVDNPAKHEFIRQLEQVRFERFGVPHTTPKDPHGRGKVLDTYV